MYLCGMKAKLIFDLNDIDDRVAHDRAVKSLDMTIALWDIDQYLRSNIKYASDDTPDNVVDTYQKVRDEFHRILNSKNIDIDTLLI